VACLASVLEVRGTQLANLDNCEHSLRIINTIVNRSGVMAQQLDTQVRVLSLCVRGVCCVCKFVISICNVFVLVQVR